MAARIVPSAKQKRVGEMIEAIAHEADASIEDVQKIYEEELQDLAHDAKITQYLGVLASRRVKERLKKH